MGSAGRRPSAARRGATWLTCPSAHMLRIRGNMTSSFASESRAAAIVRAVHAEPGMTRARPGACPGALERAGHRYRRPAGGRAGSWLRSRRRPPAAADARRSRSWPTLRDPWSPQWRSPTIAGTWPWSRSAARSSSAAGPVTRATGQRSGAGCGGGWARPAPSRRGSPRSSVSAPGTVSGAAARAGPDPGLGRPRPTWGPPRPGAARPALVRGGQRCDPGGSGRGPTRQCPRSAHGRLPAHGQRRGSGRCCSTAGPSPARRAWPASSVTCRSGPAAEPAAAEPPDAGTPGWTASPSPALLGCRRRQRRGPLHRRGPGSGQGRRARRATGAAPDGLGFRRRDGRHWSTRSIPSSCAWADWPRDLRAAGPEQLQESYRRGLMSSARRTRRP